MPNQMSFSRTGAAGDVTNARTSGNIAKFIPRNSKPSGSEAARSLPLGSRNRLYPHAKIRARPADAGDEGGQPGGSSGLH